MGHPPTFRNTHPSLRRFWHPVALESDVPAHAPLGVRLLGERWLVARLGGELVAMQDRCPHRFVPLSAGTIVDDEIQCPYHGYRLDATGRTTRIPALSADVPIPPKACVATALVTVRFGLVWLCLADEPADDIIPDHGYLDPGNDILWAAPFTTRAGASFLTHNFLDSAHFQRRAFERIGDAADHGVQCLAGRWITQEWTASLGRKDKVDIHRREGLGHLGWRIRRGGSSPGCGR